MGESWAIYAFLHFGAKELWEIFLVVLDGLRMNKMAFQIFLLAKPARSQSPEEKRHTLDRWI